MATKKASKKTAPIRALYAVPIYEAIERADAKEMKALAAQARKHVKEVKSAIASLEKKMKAE